MEIHNGETTIKVLDGKKFSGHHITKINNGYVVTVWPHTENQSAQPPEEEKYYLATKQEVHEFAAELAKIDID